MANIGNIDIGSSFSTSGLAKGIAKARSLLGGFQSKISGVATAFTGFAAVIAANTAFQTLNSVVSQTIDAMDDLGDTSSQLGTTASNLSALQHAVTLTGSEASALAPSLQKMSINLSKAGEDSKTAQAAFSKLGLDAEKLKNMDPADAFVAISNAISQVPIQADRASAAVAIFGRGSAGLLNTLSAGEGTIRALMDEAVSLGIAFNDIDAANVGAAKDALDRASGAMTGIGNAMTIALAPSIERVSMQFVQLAKNGSGTGEIIQAGVYLVEAAVWLVIKGVNLLGATFKTVQATITTLGHVAATIFTPILDAIDWITSKIPGMGTGLGDAGRAIAKDLGELAKKQFGEAGGEVAALAGYGEKLDAIKISASSTGDAVAGMGTDFAEAGEEAKKSADKIQAVQDKVKDQLATFGMTADQIELYKLKQEGATDAVIANVSAIQKQIAAMEEKKKLDEQMAADAKAIMEANRTPLEKYQQELEKINALVQRGALSPDMGQRAAEKAKKALDEATKTKVVDPDKDLKAEAKNVIEATRTPLEKYNSEILKLKEMLGKGLINPETFQRAQLEAQKTLKDSGTKDKKEDAQRSPFANALELGSNDARAAILRNRGIGGKDPMNKVEANTKEQVAQARETNRLLTQMVTKAGTDGGSVMDF